MPSKHIPLRTCMACNEMKSKKELIRLVKTKNSDDSYDIIVDKTFKSPGRGSYLCKNLDCLKKVRKSKRFNRIFSREVPDEIYTQIEEDIRLEQSKQQ